MRCSAASVAYRLLAVPVASVFCRKFEEIFADSKYRCIFAVPIGKPNAEIAQLVERNLAKVEVAGPSPVFRSKDTSTQVEVFFCILLSRGLNPPPRGCRQSRQGVTNIALTSRKATSRVRAPFSAQRLRQPLWLSFFVSGSPSRDLSVSPLSLFPQPSIPTFLI